jgi:hypothetical protein
MPSGFLFLDHWNALYHRYLLSPHCAQPADGAGLTDLKPMPKPISDEESGPKLTKLSRPIEQVKLA